GQRADQRAGPHGQGVQLVRQRVGLLEPPARGAPDPVMAFDKATVRDLLASGKRVLVRADFNVPLGSDGEVADDTRIVATLPTIRYLRSKGAAVIAMSHLGRPKGKPEPGASLAPVARRLARLLRMEVPLAPDVAGPESARLAGALQPGQILLLENL